MKQRTVVWSGVLLVLGIVVGIVLAESAARAPLEAPPGKSRHEIFAESRAHPVCRGTGLLLGLLLAVVALPRSIRAVATVILEIKRELVAIEQAQVAVEQARKRVTEPQVVEDEQGRRVLVSPTLVTRPVTLLDAEGPLDSEQLRAARLLSNALSQGGPGVGNASPPELLALALGGRMVPLEERVPPTVRILDAQEAQALEVEACATPKA